MNLSVVMAGRNDDYGGNFLQRLGTSVNVLASLASMHKLDMELIMVDWNPPEETPRLQDSLLWPSTIPINILTVPKSIHDKVAAKTWETSPFQVDQDSTKMPMLEYHAKNAGIRRARGTWVLATNPDIIFSTSMIARLVNAFMLKPDCFYRANRHDVDKCEGLSRLTVDGLLEYCATHTHTAWKPTGGGLHCEASGDFLLMAKEAWERMHGYPEFASHGVIDSYGLALAQSQGLTQIVLDDPIYHLDHERSQCAGRPRAPWEDYLKGKMNDDDWGCADLELESSLN